MVPTTPVAAVCAWVLAWGALAAAGYTTRIKLRRPPGGGQLYVRRPHVSLTTCLGIHSCFCFPSRCSVYTYMYIYIYIIIGIYLSDIAAAFDRVFKQ